MSTEGGASGCAVWFYHLEQTALDQALPELLDKTLARGWKARVCSPLTERLEHLDGWLWSWRDESFLPHGLESGPYAERQPVLLAQDPAQNPTGAEALFLLDGAEPGDLTAYLRCLILFDGRSDAAVAHARSQWKRLKSEGLDLSYWQQTARGGWEKKA